MSLYPAQKNPGALSGLPPLGTDPALGQLAGPRAPLPSPKAASCALVGTPMAEHGVPTSHPRLGCCCPGPDGTQ